MTPDHVLAWAIVVALIALVARLIALRLFRAWPFFAAYLVADILRGFALSAVNPRSNSYAEWWMISECAMLALWIAIALEVHVRIRDSYPGIGAFAWWLLIMALVAGIAVTAATAFDKPPDRRILPALFFARRAFATVLAIELIAVAAFFVHFRFNHRLAPNVARHQRMLAAYFGLQALAYALVLVFARPDGSAATWPAYGSTAASILCYLAWNKVFQAAGEVQPPIRDITPVDDIDTQAEAFIRSMRGARGAGD